MDWTVSGEYLDEMIPRSKSLCNPWVRTSLFFLWSGQPKENAVGPLKKAI